MPRPKAAVPQVLIKAWVKPELRAKMDLLLVSEVEGRVPHGKISEFIAGLMQEHFDWDEVDLGIYGMSPGYFVRGPKAMIEQLKDRLELTHAKS